MAKNPAPPDVRSAPPLCVEVLERRDTPTGGATWTGLAGDNLWENPANWDQDIVPTASLAADLTAATTTIVNQTGSIAALSIGTCPVGLQIHGAFSVGSGTVIGQLLVDGALTLTAGATLTLSSGMDLSGQVHLGAFSQLILSSTSQIHGAAPVIDGDGKVVLNATTLTIQNDASISNLDFADGNIDSSAILTVTGAMNWTAGSLTSGGTLEISEASATLNISASGAKSIEGWTFNAVGEINWTDGDVGTTHATVNVSTAGKFNISSSGTWRNTDDDNPSSINNAGEINVTNGATIEAAFNNATITHVTTADLRLANGGHFAGDFDTQGEVSVVLVKGEFFVQGPPPAIPAGQNLGSITIWGGGGRPRLNIDNVGPDFNGIVRVTRLLLFNGGLITGRGTLYITAAFVWRGGEMKTDPLLPAGTVIAMPECTSVWTLPAHQDNILDNFTFQNWGTVNWNPDPDDNVSDALEFRHDARMINYGRINVNLQVGCRARFAANGVLFGAFFQNERGAELRVVGPINGGFTSELGVFTNSGDIVVSGSSLYFENGTNWTNTGTITAHGGTVRFSDGAYKMQPDPLFLTEGSLIGTGTFVIGENANLLMPSGFSVFVRNLQLENLGTIRGAGQLDVQNLNWQAGGVIGGASVGETGIGVITLLSGGTSQIVGNVTLRQRRLVIQGFAQWNTGQSFILDGDDANMVIDGGSFDILANGANEIRNANPLEFGAIQLKNNGLFRKEFTEAPDVTLIKVYFDNEGGRVEIDGVVQWQYSSLYRQTNANAVIVYGGGYGFQVDFSLFDSTLTAGTVELLGGSLWLPNDQTRLNGVTLKLRGYVSGFSGRNVDVRLTGELWLSSDLRLTGASCILLEGNQLNVSGTIHATSLVYLYLQEGIINTTQPYSPVLANVVPSGWINGVFYGC